MANPIFIPIQFAANGIKNIIQKTLQSGQDAQDATWSAGWGGRTMIPIEAGGLPPKGQDFNGVLYALSDAAFHRQGGKEIQFNPLVVSELGGYDEGAIIQADNFSCHYRSLIPNNTANPNTEAILGKWMIYSGQGSVYPASSTVSGMMKVLDVLTSKDAFSALSANMGRVLNEKILAVRQPVIASCRINNSSNATPVFASNFGFKSVQRLNTGYFLLTLENEQPDSNYTIIVTGSMSTAPDAGSFSGNVDDGYAHGLAPSKNSFRVAFTYGGDTAKGYYSPYFFYVLVIRN